MANHSLMIKSHAGDREFGIRRASISEMTLRREISNLRKASC